MNEQKPCVAEMVQKRREGGGWPIWRDLPANMSAMAFKTVPGDGDNARRRRRRRRGVWKGTEFEKCTKG